MTRALPGCFFYGRYEWSKKIYVFRIFAIHTFLIIHRSLQTKSSIKAAEVLFKCELVFCVIIRMWIKNTAAVLVSPAFRFCNKDKSFTKNKKKTVCGRTISLISQWNLLINWICHQFQFSCRFFLFLIFNLFGKLNNIADPQHIVAALVKAYVNSPNNLINIKRNWKIK